MENFEVKDLISGCMQQSRPHQNRLYQKYFSFARAICMRYVPSAFEAAEILNSGFLKVFLHLESYKQDRPFKGWIGRIMINESLDYLKSNKFYRSTEDLSSSENLQQPEKADSALVFRELLDQIYQLPPPCRQVFQLFAIEGYSHQEIAELMTISEGSSRITLHRARQQLLQMIRSN